MPRAASFRTELERAERTRQGFLLPADPGEWSALRAVAVELGWRWCGTLALGDRQIVELEPMVEAGRMAIDWSAEQLRETQARRVLDSHGFEP
jgi:hypothetical protein